MDEKVYKPATIEEQPFPGLTQTGFFNDSETTTAKSTYNPKTVQDRPIPQKIVSHETIGQSLNTKSKKILQEFGFTESGAIAIGKLLEGISGDIRITPNGVVARDSSGNITFALDGDTGNATFAGQLRSGSVITGRIEMGPDGYIAIGDESGGTILDQYGLVSTTNFPAYSLEDTPVVSFTDTTYTTRGGAINFSLRRSTLATISLSVVGSSEQINGALDCSGRTYYSILDNTIGDPTLALAEFYYDSFITVSSGVRENIISKTYGRTEIYELAEGDHTVRIQSKIANNTNFRSVLNDFSISIALLGS